ncbi:NAD-dependent epimerase/dehydratase family protein [Exiguobacterium sp. s189]|uniref:NAD-dependent epimerase/dehydratase family protein n=1 Tax=Exiguobacterium sp. s189 TaxID=2751263 RepID=UPI001BE550D3|nr:NAD-dependent epimerase/dehydratase family protein [Exiguobacterium sp. s189]
MKKILITGESSYIGKEFKNWINYKFPILFQVDCISIRDNKWRKVSFSEYDVILHLAAIVHKKETPDMEELYNQVNCNLTIDLAKKAKVEGVNQFIFMSTMAVYGEVGEIKKVKIIDENTKPAPSTLYGRSKFTAENRLKDLISDKFKIAIIRPPMIYGPNCPGNYSKLIYLAERVPIFPLINNQRSMLHINNLNDLLFNMINDESEGIFFPQDEEYINTSILVKSLAEKNGKNLVLSRSLGRLIEIFGFKVNLINKVFGNLVYEKKYRKRSIYEK